MVEQGVRYGSLPARWSWNWGADRFVALDEEHLQDAAAQADLVFNTIGGQVLAQSARVVQPGGTLVSVSAFPPFGREDTKEIFFIQESNRAQLIELTRLADQGHLRAQVGAVYPLAQAAEAYALKPPTASRRVILQP